MAVNEFTDVLTTGELAGTGSFDVLMRATKEHLKGEFDAGRIRGTDYANAYVQATSAVLAQATQYSISQSRLASELELMAAQTNQVKQETQNALEQENLIKAQVAQTTQETLNAVAQNALITQQTTNLLTENTQSQAKHLLDLQSIEAQIAKITTDTVVATKQAALVDAQAIGEQARTQNTEASTRRTDYETNFVLPAQLLTAEEQTTLVTKQIEQTTQQTLNMAAEKERIMKQTAQITAETTLRNIEIDMQEFNRDFKQAVELDLMQKDADLRERQVTISDKEVLLKQAQIDLSVKDIAIKQSQLELSAKELLLKQAQVDLSAKEVLLKTEQVSLTKYELANKLPAEVALLGAQNSLYVQKTVTEKAQTDNTVVGLNSVTDINNKLILEQSKTYLRTFQQNAAKMMVDTWNVRHTADPDGNLENSSNKLLDANIGRVLDKLATELGITLA